MNNMTAQQRVERAHAIIVRTPELAAFSSLVMMGDAVIDPEVSTARTDGRNIYYGKEFIQTLTDAELVFVAMHEALHIGYRHLITWDKLFREDPQLCNAACDYVINLILHDLSKTTDKLAFPMRDGKPVGLLDEQYRGLHAGDVFRMLKQKDEEQKQQQQQQQQGGGGQGSAGEDGEDGEQQEQPTPLRQEIAQQQFDEHDFDGASDMTADEKEELSDTVDRAMRQGAMAAGKMGGALPRDLQDLLTPVVDWRTAMAEYVGAAVSREPDESTWRRYHRRTAGIMDDFDVFMPSYFSERISKVVVAIDLSGSVFHLAEKFVAEVVKICTDVEPEELHLLYWDTSVQRHEVYTPAQYSLMTSTTKPSGGGGTDVRCVPEHMRSNNLTDADCVIVLTDGEFFYGQGDWDVPVLWCVIEPYDKAFTPTVGSKLAVKI